MAKKFHGTYEELKTILAATEVQGKWSSEAGGKYIFRSRTGGIVNWWENAGTIQFQGTPEEQSVLERAFESALTDSPAIEGLTSTKSTSASSGQQYLQRSFRRFRPFRSGV